MKYFLIFLVLAMTNLKAQTDLKFDKRFVECEDKWVAFQMNKDSTFNFGFIYIDSQAGLTLNYEGNFKISQTDKYIPKRIDTTSIKVRLNPNNVLVAFIPEIRFNELKIQAIPDWLKFYKTDTASVERLYRWGYMYNEWNECTKALPYLIKANELDPNFEGLAVELAFSYNCLNEFNKALEILEVANKTNPTDAYINKEFIYSLTKMKEIERATTQFYNSTKVVKENTYNAENCFNIMQYYYNQKDNKNFKIWYDELKKWPNVNEQITKYAENWKNELK